MLLSVFASSIHARASETDDNLGGWIEFGLIDRAGNSSEIIFYLGSDVSQARYHRAAAAFNAALAEPEADPLVEAMRPLIEAMRPDGEANR